MCIFYWPVVGFVISVTSSNILKPRKLKIFIEIQEKINNWPIINHEVYQMYQ